MGVAGEGMVMIEQGTIACQPPGCIFHKKSPVLLMSVIVVQNIICNLHFQIKLPVRFFGFLIGIQPVISAEYLKFLKCHHRNLLGGKQLCIHNGITHAFDPLSPFFRQIGAKLFL